MAWRLVDVAGEEEVGTLLDRGAGFVERMYRPPDPPLAEHLPRIGHRQVSRGELHALGAERAGEVGPPIDDHCRLRRTCQRDEAPPRLGELLRRRTAVPEVQGGRRPEGRDRGGLPTQIGIGEDAAVGHRVEARKGSHSKRGRAVSRRPAAQAAARIFALPAG